MAAKLIRALVAAIFSALPAASLQASPVSAVFRVNPLRAINLVSALPGQTKVPICDLEVDLLRDGQDGRLDRWTLREAALVVSGVTDAARRKRYLRQLDAIEQQARQATAGAETPAAAAEALLHSLHGRAFRGGFQNGQSDLRYLLDTGRYNCVSSAVLYDLVGRRLGINVRAVEMPLHVFCTTRTGDGDIDIETTSDPGIYASEIRMSRIRKKIADGNVDSIWRNTLYREGNTLALLGMMYDSQASRAWSKEHYRDSTLFNFKALCLDPQSARCVKKIQQGFADWFQWAMRKQRYREAYSVAQTYKRLLRNPAEADEMLRKAKRSLGPAQRRAGTNNRQRRGT